MIDKIIERSVFFFCVSALLFGGFIPHEVWYVQYYIILARHTTTSRPPGAAKATIDCELLEIPLTPQRGWTPSQSNAMITFLPTPDFAQSASMLDSRRLGNQRVEARMILRWLRNPEAYPRHQNAGYTIMWKGYEDALCLNYNACCEEWARRGGRNVICQPEAISSCGGGGGGGGASASASARLPPWLGDEAFHRTHRSALLHKLPDHYGKFGWGVEIPVPDVNYLWPRPPAGGGGRSARGTNCAPPVTTGRRRVAKSRRRRRGTRRRRRVGRRRRRRGRTTRRAAPWWRKKSRRRSGPGGCTRGSTPTT